MKTILSLLVFLLIGSVAGVAFHKKYDTSLLLNVILGIVGSLGVSWLVGLLGLGSGFMALSLWGIVFGIVGAVLLPLIYGLMQNRSAKKTTAA